MSTMTIAVANGRERLNLPAHSVKGFGRIGKRIWQIWGKNIDRHR
jgi:hypothetical protein